MGVAYDGVPGNLAYPAALSIASSTNASPIAVTTSSPHGLLTGDVVSIYSHQTNTNANGANQTITRTGTNTFTINGSTGNGVGGATGTVQPLTYGSAGTIPSDADANSASTYNAAFQPIFDRSAIVVPSFGHAKLVGRQTFFQAHLPSTGFSWASFSGTLTAATFTQLTLSALSAMVVPGGGSLSIKSASGPYSMSGLLNTSDYVHITMSASHDQSSTLSDLQVVLMYAVVAPGAGSPAFGTYAYVPPSGYPVGPSTIDLTAIRTEGWLPNAIGISGADLYIQPAIFSTAGGVYSGGLQGEAAINVEVWRPTGVPQ